MPLRNRARSLVTDRRGLSTLEYALLYLLVLVALLMVWQKLGRDLVTEVEKGRGTFSDTLQHAMAPGGLATGSSTLTQKPGVFVPTPGQAAPPHSNALASPSQAAIAPKPSGAALTPPSAAVAPAPAPGASAPSPAPPSAASTGSAQAPQEAPGFWSGIGTSIQNSTLGQAAIGVGYGLHQAFTPGGFLVVVSPSSQPAFQIGHSLGQAAGGILQIVGGDVITGAGLGIGGLGVVAEGPSLGTSTVAVVGGAAIATGGYVVSANGAANVAGAANQLIHMASGSGKPTSGDTEAAKTGKEVHAKRAAERRASGEWDEVNSQMKDENGDVIEVPKRVDLKTGRPAVEETQKVQPDAVSYKRGEILDDKPLGRSMAKDRQEIIRFIKAYQEKTGKLPDRIVIERYNPADGSPAGREVYSPKDFLP